MTTILIVDDSPIDQRIVGGIVEEEGMIATYADNGQSALDQMSQNVPDVVMTDLQMPVMNGLELVRRIKSEYPTTPVVLITREGSEEIAVEALRVGASSYVPKCNLKRDLGRVMEAVLSSVEVLRERESVRDLLQQSEAYYILGYDPAAPKALIGHLQNSLSQTAVANESDLMRVGVALTEALANAIDHGNLGLDSKLRDNDYTSYSNVRYKRSHQVPYCHRKVHVTARLTQSEATFIIRDEGPGFDPNTLPDPTDTDNITKAGGRGVMLIRAFMDDVKFNEAGNEITMVKRTSGR